ncbi:hypothetical protein PUNSTDRAFT_120406 [Punctularia strigosozonata HHB-11173 SS5]|uniref:uncharacterized protein n=1 Tax=Punctularia strigosozonata (strain HHB-11173) TaxID=741275 RepID=UPI0004417A5C|nr:uncharacterized protein PUNSTDRAFT_120406 [Punctularia strigosozonata HHB-11173 SS5]EIN08848.1 hypothetical protein PUNSTDRAFT_120406 [Punctularia strigosozonata HHB-11173 SS5]
MDVTREDHQRISIDSVQDWKAMKQSYRSAARAQLDELLATSADVGAQHRELMLQHLNRFVDDVFESTKPNIRVNGMKLEDVLEDEEDSEPFDEALDRHIWSLADQRMKWQQEVANKRRTVPGEVAELVDSLLERQRSADAEPALADEDVAVDSEPEVEGELGIPPEAEFRFKLTTTLAGELEQELPLQRQRSERVQDVARTLRSRKE